MHLPNGNPWRLLVTKQFPKIKIHWGSVGWYEEAKVILTKGQKGPIYGQFLDMRFKISHDRSTVSDIRSIPYERQNNKTVYDGNKISKTIIHTSRVVHRSVNSCTRIQALEIQGQRSNISIILRNNCACLTADRRYRNNGMSARRDGSHTDSSTKTVLRQNAPRTKERQQTGNRRTNSYDELQATRMGSTTLEKLIKSSKSELIRKIGPKSMGFKSPTLDRQSRHQA